MKLNLISVLADVLRAFLAYRDVYVNKLDTILVDLGGIIQLLIGSRF